MVGDFGWEHEGTKSRVGTVNRLRVQTDSLNFWRFQVILKCSVSDSNP